MQLEERLFQICFSAVLVGAILLGGCRPKEETPLASGSSTSAAPILEKTNLFATNATTESEENKSALTPGISGKIILQGAPPPEREIAMEPTCGKLHATIPKTRLYVVGDNGALADVFVYIKEGLSGKTFDPPAAPILLDQVGCEYTPYVIGLQTKQKLLVRNSDPVMHNVHPLPKVAGNQESNRAQMPKGKDYEYTFENPEIFLTYKCDIHPWMYAYVGVVENPFFAVSGADGTFHLKNVPAGKYVVEAYHRKAGKLAKDVTVVDGKSAPINFTFEIPRAQ